MDIEIIKKRVKAVYRRLREKKVDCLIITTPANVTYTTGFSGDDTWAIVTAAGVYLLTDSRYIEQADHECVNCKVINRIEPLVKTAARLIKKLKSADTVAVEKSTSLYDFQALKKTLKGRLKAIDNITEPLRSTKDSTEVTAIKKAAQIASKAFAETLKRIKPAITEDELAGILDFEIRRLGARSSFATIAAFGANASRPHHQPGRRKLRKNDSVLIDFGVRYKNYCCDLTRCFTIGRPTAFYKKVYNAVRQAQSAAIKMIKPGVEIRKVDAAARRVIADYDLPVYGHGTGHGLGLEVHEQPILSCESKGRLKAGMVFTVEPAVYLPGKLGVRIEDDVLVTQKGCEVLTRNCPQINFDSYK